MGIGDSIRSGISKAIGADTINAALTPAPAAKAQTGDFPRSSRSTGAGNTAGHVTSGLDQAMRDQADQLHPRGGSSSALQKAATGADWDK